jgi:hypothetical protein
MASRQYDAATESLGQTASIEIHDQADAWPFELPLDAPSISRQRALQLSYK